MQELKSAIRSVLNFPKPGIEFYDITTLLLNTDAFNQTLTLMQNYIEPLAPKKLVGIESRGFIFGAALSVTMQLPFVPVRKPGKLPAETIQETYQLEYGHDQLEIHTDAINQGERIVIVDDLIATGGTMLATCKLIERLGGNVAGICTLIALTSLPFQDKLASYDVHSLLNYE